jgi:hypothetical protein
LAYQVNESEYAEAEMESEVDSEPYSDLSEIKLDSVYSVDQPPQQRKRPIREAAANNKAFSHFKFKRKSTISTTVIERRLS